MSALEKKKPLRLRVRTKFFLLLITAVLTCALLIGGIASALFTRVIEKKTSVSGNELVDAAVSRLAKYMQDLDGLSFNV